MARLAKVSTVLMFGGIAAACAQGHAMDGGQGMSAAIADATQENERHAEACMGASSMSGMMEELGQHEGAMARMDDARERMGTGSMMGNGHCSDRSFEHMTGSLNGVHSEMSGHSERMRVAATLDAAQSGCVTHTDAMRGMMQGIMDDLHTMPCMSP